MKPTIILSTIFAVIFLPFSLWAKPGDLIQVMEMPPITSEELDKIIYNFCPGVNSKIGQTQIRYFSLVYETTDIKGRPIRASGALLIPGNGQANYSVVSYQHGTLFDRAGAPSLAGLWREGRVIGGCYASQGYAVVEADYIGYGVSKDFHPYYYTPVEGPVAADALLASKEATRKLGLHLDGKLFLSGYSQGAHVTLALQKYLEENPSTGLRVTASAAMAGAYQISETVRAVLKNPDFPSAVEAAFLLLSYFKVYSLYPSLNDMILPKYASNLESLLPGEYSLGKLLQLLPGKPEDLLQPAFLKDLLSNSENPFYKALQKNDIYNWKPNTPVMFIHGDKDIQVPTFNSILANETMQKLGAKTQLVLLQGKDHETAVTPAFLQSIRWFNSL
jgi:pimeloyl-ACP methyl ester carboxylesterase